MKRKAFVKSLLGTSAFLSLPNKLWSENYNETLNHLEQIKTSTQGSMMSFSDKPIKTVNIGIIGLGNRGQTLLQMLKWLNNEKHCEVVALCDLDKTKIQTAEKELKRCQKKLPKTYVGDQNAWKKLTKQDNIDLVLITTPWKWHTPMSVYAMQNGKHVACEVPIAYTIEDCWLLTQTAEQTKRHCIMIENCCYNDEELWVLNMIEEGVFGDITHAEGAYLHDLRAHMLSDTYYKKQWRLKHHIKRNGNFYTTHGLGPVSMYLNIGRGDTFDYLTSMSSRELNLSQAAKSKNATLNSFQCGDMNSTLIKTTKGKTILLQFDVHTGQPYSRINKVTGTKAVHQGYPSRLFIDSDQLKFYGHSWLTKEDYTTYRNRYEHPMIKKLKTISSQFKQGHGGMDFIMMYRLIRCLNLGLPLDLNVYDGVLWSAVTPLSELSVANNSLPMPIPDFTNGHWKSETEKEIMRVI